MEQAFNSCAYIIAPAVGGFLLFGQEVDSAHPDFHPLILTCVVLGCVVILIFGIFSFIYLSVMNDGCQDEEAGDSPTFKAPLARQMHFAVGVVPQFLYIISQIGINAFAANYIVENAIVKDAARQETTSPLFAWFRSGTYAANADATAAYVIFFALPLMGFVATTIYGLTYPRLLKKSASVAA